MNNSLVELVVVSGPNGLPPMGPALLLHTFLRSPYRLAPAQLVRAQGIELAKSGKDWRGRCPFHEDSTPSLVVTPSKNLWHCFGCNVGGGPVDWAMKANGISFRHAVELLREGIPSLAAKTGAVRTTVGFAPVHPDTVSHLS